MPRTSRLLTLALFIGAAVTFAQTAARLLPDSVSREVRTTWKQDGRAIDLTATAPRSDWVIEALLVKYQYQAAQTSTLVPMHFNRSGELRPGKANPSKGEVDAEVMPPSQQTGQVQLKVELLPGNSTKSNFEVEAGDRLVTLMVIEARGRELRITDRLRSLLP